MGEWDLPPSPLCLVARVIFFQNQCNVCFPQWFGKENIINCGCEASWIQFYTKFTTCQPWFFPENPSIFRFGAWSIRTVYCSFSIPSLRLWIACGMGFRWWSPRPRPWWLCFGASELEKGSEGLKALRIETYSNYTRVEGTGQFNLKKQGWPVDLLQNPKVYYVKVSYFMILHS